MRDRLKAILYVFSAYVFAGAYLVAIVALAAMIVMIVGFNRPMTTIGFQLVTLGSMLIIIGRIAIIDSRAHLKPPATIR